MTEKLTDLFLDTEIDESKTTFRGIASAADLWNVSGEVYSSKWK